jgi:hypothetical protein
MENDIPRRSPPPVPPPPPLPPPEPFGAPPPPPLQYAMPVTATGDTNTIFHQAAKASWVAPLMVIVLGCLVSGAVRGLGDTMIVPKIQAGVSLLLIVGGLVCGIVALCGIRRVGKEGVLVPTIVGLTLNGLWILLLGGIMVTATRSTLVSRRATAGGSTAVAAPAPIPFTSPQSALRQTGWMGVAVTPGGCTVGAMAMAEPHVDTANLKSNFTTPCPVLVLWFDNRANSKAATVATDGATLRMDDGTTVNALRTADVLSTAKVDRASLMTKFAPPHKVPAGVNVEGMFLFLPPTVDLSKATFVYLTVDGQRVSIPGRVYTAQEKSDGLARTNAPQ